MRKVVWCVLALTTLACSKKQPNLAALPPGAPAVSGATIDSLWAKAELAYRRGWWHEAQVTLERLNLEMKPQDPRLPRMHFMLGEVLAVPLDDVKAWVSSWGSENELPRPQPRKVG